MNNAIQIYDLKKSYGSREVLKGLNFHVTPGEIFGLLGVNGAGKTTTLECIEGLRKYDGGEIRINGTMGIQLQLSALPSHIKAIEAVKLFAMWNHVKADMALLEVLGIRELEKKQYGYMSEGQKRRLNLALAMIKNPEILVLDEPLAGLDVEGRVALHEMLRERKEQGRTIILSSHDMAEVGCLCDRIAILKEGRIVFLGTIEALREKMGGCYAIRIRTDQGEENFVSHNIGETMLPLLKGYKERKIEVLDIQIDRGTLEEYFMKIARENGQ